MTIERAEAWRLVDPFTMGEWLVQFWDTHSEDCFGKRRMAYAVFQQHPAFPTTYMLVAHGRRFYPSPTVSCDGPEAAKHLMSFMAYDGHIGEDVCSDDLLVSPIGASEETFLKLG